MVSIMRLASRPDGFPRPAKGGGWRSVPPSGALRGLATRLKWLLAYCCSPYALPRYRRVFGDVERYVMFLGYPRSGSSLLGSLLNAHPEIVIAHELDALRYVRVGVGRNELFALLLERDRWYADQGRKGTAYDDNVPGQWHGRFERLRVIGDKKNAGSTWWLRYDPTLLDRLRRTVRVPVRFIHLVRNPYDNIATWAKKRSLALEQAAEEYFMLAETVATVTKGMEEAELIQVHHEDVVADPRAALRKLCGWLGISAPQDYLDACASVVFESPRRSRTDASWGPELVRSVAERMKPFPFLARYGFGA